jgi:EAL domain-containing protein (putative c-di-GMP-specific phosphodiesterase class I)
MPVNEIKLDRAFIQYLDTSNKDQLVVKSTIDLAHALGYSVVAEGVENKASMQLLSEMKCDFVQGYFVSRPLAANQIIGWYENYVENPNFFDTESA